MKPDEFYRSSDLSDEMAKKAKAEVIPLFLDWLSKQELVRGREYDFNAAMSYIRKGAQAGSLLVLVTDEALSKVIHELLYGWDQGSAASYRFDLITDTLMAAELDVEGTLNGLIKVCQKEGHWAIRENPSESEHIVYGLTSFLETLPASSSGVSRSCARCLAYFIIEWLREQEEGA